jgi:hypothetical protein
MLPILELDQFAVQSTVGIEHRKKIAVIALF